MTAYYLAVLAPLLAAIGHVVLKRAAIQGWKTNPRSSRAAKIALSGLLFGLSAISGVWCLRFLDFSQFYSMTALNYVFIAFFAKWHLAEPFDRAKAIGSALTVAGIVVYNL